MAAAIAWPVTQRWWNVPTESQLSSASLMIINSAAQMEEPQMCNNSIKLTSLCFHKVRYTERHPLEFHILLLLTLHPFQKNNLCGQGYSHCLCLLCNHFQGTSSSTLESSHYKNIRLHGLIHGETDSSWEIGRGEEATEVGSKQNPYLILCSHLDMCSFKSA